MTRPGWWPRASPPAATPIAARVLVKAPVHDVARLISPYAGVSTAHGPDTLVELGVDDFDWLAGFLIGLGLEFEVIEPVELRRHMVTLGARLRRDHPRTGPTVPTSPPRR